MPTAVLFTVYPGTAVLVRAIASWSEEHEFIYETVLLANIRYLFHFESPRDRLHAPRYVPRIVRFLRSSPIQDLTGSP